MKQLKIQRKRKTVGIEIDDHAIKIIEFYVDKSYNIVTKQLIKEWLPADVVKGGKIQHMPAMVRILKNVVKQASSRLHKKCHFIIPSQVVMVRYLKLPNVSHKELKKLVDFELKHNIHLPFEDPYYDFVKQDVIQAEAVTQDTSGQVINAVTEAGQGLEEAAASREEDGKQQNHVNLCNVLLVAAPMNVIEQYMYLFDAVGLKLKSIEIKAFSMLRLVQAGMLVDHNDVFLSVDLNRYTSDLSVFDQGLLKITRSIPVSFTIEPSEETAENELLKEFMKDQGDVRFNNALSELAHELERLMNFYRYRLNHRNQQFSRIICSGDMERITEVANYLSERLSMEVILVDRSDFFVNTEDSKQASAFAAAIGAGTRGLVK